MPVQNLTLSLPEALYDQIKERAAQCKRSIEDETLDLLAQSMPVADILPQDLAADIAHLALLDNETLQRAAGNRLATDAAAELETLHVKQQREQLTPAENEACAALIKQYERAMLIRAQAVRLLSERSLNVDAFLPTS